MVWWLASKGFVRDEIDKVRDEAGKCSLLMNGVHVCTESKYDTEVALRDLTFEHLFEPTTDVCVKVSSVNDVFPPQNIPPSLQDKSLPTNYICIEKNALDQYRDIFASERIKTGYTTAKENNMHTAPVTEYFSQ